MTVGLMAIDLLMEWAEFSINLYASIPAHADAFKAVLFGPFWWVFWFGHVLFGVAVPLAMLLIWPRRPKVVGAAGFLIASLFIAVRANIVIPGQVIPELAGLERAFTDQRLTFAYMPSTVELLVGVFVLAFGTAVFFIGTWLLPLTRGTTHGASVGGAAGQ
jgi:molybdopterin-containing oxidoreductase family membrane subunit